MTSRSAGKDRADSVDRMTIRSRPVPGLILFLLCTAVAPLPGFSADQAAIVPLPRKEAAAPIDGSWLGGDRFALTYPKLGLNTLFLMENETFHSNGTDQQNSVYEFREGFSVATDGWLVHPAFLTLDLRLDPQWSQVGGSGDGPKPENSTVFLGSYATAMTFLPKKLYTFRLFADRTEDNLISTFTNQTRVDTDTYGASLAYKWKRLPTFVNYQHLNRNQQGFFDSEEERDDIRLNTTNQYGDFDTRLSLQYIDSQQTSDVADTDLRDFNTRLDNTWRFQADPNRLLLSDLSYRASEDGDFSRTDLRLFERLYLKHRKNLWTNSSFVYQNLETDQFSEDRYRLDSELTHLLYENLTTTVFGSGERRNFTDSNETAYTGALDFDYRRDIPWGTIGATAGVRDVYTVRNGEQGLQVINNETQVLDGGQGTFLDQEFIDADSIRVTDSTGTIVYLRDLDYLVEQAGTFIRLRRSLLGNIAANQTVLVSYRFAGEPDFDDNVVSQSYGANLFLFSKLRLSYNYFHRKQQVIAGPEPVDPIDDTVQRTALQFTYRWSETRLSFEDFQTTTSPARTTWRAEELFNVRVARSIGLRLSGYYGETDFERALGRETFYGTASSINWSPTYWTKAGFEGFVDWVDSDTINSTNGGALAFWQLLYGRWQARLSYRYRETLDDRDDFQRTEQRILLTIERTL